MTESTAEQILKKDYPIQYYALKYHRTHKFKPLEFDQHKYLKQIYFDNSDYIVVIKSTQNGISEWALSRSIGEAMTGRSVFYVFPTDKLVYRFVRNRFDKTMDATPFYQAQIKTGKVKNTDSMSLKHLGAGAIAFVGSNSSSAFAEFPADTVLIDELDYCDQENIKMAWERLSQAEHKHEIKIGNPTIEGYGVDKEFADTCKYEWFLTCQCGNRLDRKSVV